MCSAGVVKHQTTVQPTQKKSLIKYQTFKLVHNSVYDTTLLCALAVVGHLNTAKEKRGVASIYVQAVSIPITQNIIKVYKSLKYQHIHSYSITYFTPN
jgi:hypothetical protein